MSEDRGYGASLALAFILGGVMGASLALLFAPKTGRETRERLKELAGEMRQRTGEVAGEVKATAEKVIEEGKSYLGEKKSLLTAALEAGKEAMEREKARLTERQP